MRNKQVRIIPYLIWIMRTDTESVKVAIMITMAVAGLIGAIISGVVAAGSAVANTVSQAKTNEANKANVDATNAMNEQLTRESWARDDSQLQRARADAQAAGFSPLAALSNNLTNTAPATMQPYQATAPQFDSSGLISSIQEGTKGYQNGQMSDTESEYIKSQTKAQNIQNEINNATKWSQKLQNVANLVKTMKELDAQNLSNYEKASILVASGIPSNTVQKLIPYTTKDTVVKNTSQDSLIKLQEAQKNLANAQKTLTDEQTTTQQKIQALYEQQTALTKVQAETQQADYNFWYKALDSNNASVYVPERVDGKWIINKIESKGRNRKELADYYQQKMNGYLNYISTYNFNWETSDINFLNQLSEKNAQFMLEILKLAK